MRGRVAKRLLFAASGCLVMTGTLIASAASPEVTASREAFAACARKSLDAYEKIEGVTPAGLAFFTGLSCARAREDYRQALTTSGARDVERMMQAIDARMINFILGDWADKKLKQ